MRHRITPQSKRSISVCDDYEYICLYTLHQADEQCYKMACALIETRTSAIQRHLVKSDINLSGIVASALETAASMLIRNVKIRTNDKLLCAAKYQS